MSKSSRLFVGLSLLLLAFVSAFIALNRSSARHQLEDALQRQAEQERATYRLALKMEYASLLKMAQTVAEDPVLQQVFLRGKRAVLQEGGGTGGPKAAAARKELYAHVEGLWARLRDDFYLRQMHFHIGPGSLSFLRVHIPQDFGDRLDDLRLIVVDTNADAKPRTAFETGHHNSGLRGVVPFFATDPDTGERVQVGALELGASFRDLFDTLSQQTGSGVAALVRNTHYQSKIWANRTPEAFNTRPRACNCTVDEYSSPEIKRILKALAPLPEFDGPLLVTRGQLADRQLLLTHLPLFDYQAQRDGLDKPVGRILIWHDITDMVQLFERGHRRSVFYGVFGFLVLEMLLYAFIQVGGRRLQQEIDDQTRQLRRQRDQMQTLSDQAEAANQAKSAFLASMSHELRTPLNAISGFCQLLQRAPDLNAEHQRALTTIRHSSDQLRLLVDDILDLAKIETGRLSINPTPLALRPFLARVAALFEPAAEHKRLALSVSVSEALPEALELDERRLRQMLVNLLGNALKFTEKGWVSVSADYQAGVLILEVADTGRGVPEGVRERIFAPFYQDKLNRYEHMGPGLGLSIVRSLAERMGGTLLLDSEEGRGSRFRLRIPAATATPMESVPAGSESGVRGLPSEASSGAGCKLCQLPPSLLPTLKNAVILGDTNAIGEILEDITMIDPNIGARLAERLRNYDYQTVLDHIAACMKDADAPEK